MKAKWFARFTMVLMLLAGVIPVSASGPPNGDGLKGVKVRVSDSALALRLVKEGKARLVADYGSFDLLATDDAEAAALQRSGQGESREDYSFIKLNSGWIRTDSGPSMKALGQQESYTGKRLHLVQFAGPVQAGWYEALQGTGVRVVSYIPSNAYLVYGDEQSLTRLQEMARSAKTVQWEGAYESTYKVDGAITARAQKSEPAPALYAIQMVKDLSVNGETLKAIDGLKLKAVANQFEMPGYLNVIVSLPPGAVATLAARPDVVSIQSYQVPALLDERQDMIVSGNLSGNFPSGPGYMSWLMGKGFTQAQFTTSGFGVDVTDSGIDNGTTSPNHFGLYLNGIRPGTSRVLYNRLEGTPNGGSTLKGCDGHGTLNTHIVAGYVPNGAPYNTFPFSDSSGYQYGLGVCPFVKVGSSVIFDPGYTYPNYFNLQSEAYNNGMRISTNSWGAATSGTYTVDDQAYDALVRDAQPAGSTYPTAGNQEMVIVFAAGNSGPGAGTVGSPGAAKNVITVGASENVQAFGGADRCGVADSDASSANEMAFFSSRGPCTDGRIKPDLCAPGTHVSGGVIQVASPPSNGQADPCFTGSGVCGGVNSIFYPAGQQWYTASSGTSHSTPAVSGATALVRQYFLNSGFAAPSPAITKAFLMNSAHYMTGVTANDTLWSNSQGMGLMDLGMAFDGVARVLWDELPGNLFTATGQTRMLAGNISDSSKPFRVTLAWTDAPGSTSGAAYNNNLDLVVTVGGQTYKGNVFNGAYSVTGGAADSVNNVESVFVPAGVSGGFSVTVNAANINSQGVPGSSSQLSQDFALVVYNGVAYSGPIIQPVTATLTSEGCSAPNGVPDPGEWVTYNLSLQNVGIGPSANLVATLQATGGVLSPSIPQTYGALAPGSAPVAMPFSFRVDPALACGGQVVATLHLMDGATDLGNVAFTLQTGVLQTTLSENFDAVTAPALPSGWTATVAQGNVTPWQTSTTGPSSSPNDVFATDAAFISDNRLDTPAIAITSDHANLTFKNSYNVENGYDGCVLEISIAGGAFQDILAAGGSFSMGGYNKAVATGYSNPLAGRQAWSGNSQGYITTSMTLPASANGQNVVLRFREGTDTSTGISGWLIDDVAVYGGYLCRAGPACPVISVSPATLPAGTAGSAYSQNVVATGGTGPYAYTATEGSLPNGLTLSTGGVLSGTPATSGSFSFTVFATDANGCGGSENETLAITGSCPAITVLPASLPGGAVGSAYAQTITATGGAAPYTFSVTAGSLPTGLSLSSSGGLSGTPTVSRNLQLHGDGTGYRTDAREAQPTRS